MAAGKLGYTPRKALYKNDAQLADDIRSTIYKLCDQMNTAKSKGIEVNFSVDAVADTRTGQAYSPRISIKRLEEL